jgi:NarL family two-component system sensor histidine kinase LiaS
MNAVRHGKATHIVIEGKTDQNLTTLIVTDNGSGFDTGRKTKGFGFVSMRERIRDLPDGTLEIKSIIDAGTQIKLSWKNEI